MKGKAVKKDRKENVSKKGRQKGRRTADKRKDIRGKTEVTEKERK
jgi:hypothetical protein